MRNLNVRGNIYDTHEYDPGMVIFSFNSSQNLRTKGCLHKCYNLQSTFHLRPMCLPPRRRSPCLMILSACYVFMSPSVIKLNPTERKNRIISLLTWVTLYQRTFLLSNTTEQHQCRGHERVRSSSCHQRWSPKVLLHGKIIARTKLIQMKLLQKYNGKLHYLYSFAVQLWSNVNWIRIQWKFTPRNIIN